MKTAAITAEEGGHGPKERKAISAAKRARLEEIFKRASKVGQEKGNTQRWN